MKRFLPQNVLLCDFHIHTRWSDGKLTLSEVINLFGEHCFDVIAITDHVSQKNDPLVRAGKMTRLSSSITELNFSEYLTAIQKEAKRAWDEFKMIVIPGLEMGYHALRARKRAHIVALLVKEFISADQPPYRILEAIKAQDAISVAAHPYYCERQVFQTHYLWENRDKIGDLVDVWEIASRDELFDLIHLNHSPLPYIASSDLHKKEHIFGWKTLLFCEKNNEAIKNCLKENKNIAISFFGGVK